MTLNEVMNQLEEYGTEQAVRIYHNHGCDIHTYGVSVANLKKIWRPIKKDKELGKELFFSSNSDAIYLSQWIVDTNDITIEDLEDRILFSNYYMLIEYAIPNIIVNDRDLADRCIEKWLNHEESRFRQAAYTLYSLMLSKYPDETLDLEQVSQLLDHIEEVIHDEENRVRYAMNGFVICAGTYIKSLHEKSMRVADTIGSVDVNMGKTACKVPHAFKSIQKVTAKYGVGHKRK